MNRGRGAPDRDAVYTKARQQALVYLACHREDGDAPDVIMGMFFIHKIPHSAIIDIGSTHSYVACTVTMKLGIPVENTPSGITILSPLVQSVRVNKVFKDVPLEIQGVIFLADLMDLPFEEFDLILGMYWLVKHRGCEAFLVYVSVSKVRDSSMKDIRIVKDFPDVFPEELLRLPLEHDVEFGIDLFPGTAPVSITRYRMASKDLMELKAQI
ncbi:uncharacterized protein LOC108472737 [Gossypium arboreum]|uniref:uncharacterized protein LOC108472737 n=1 Tax=Gossypium arboreum TaxID=29729 RepID=UPI00081965D0|nr:uncharacterized protein LOC108472737 [Gossypium arboreum]